MLIRIIIVSLIILFVEWYFYYSIRAFFSDFSAKFRKRARITYWIITGIILIYAGLTLLIPFSTWPKVIRIYLTSLIFTLSFSKLIGCLFLLLDDVLRIFRFCFQKIKNILSKKPSFQAHKEDKISRSKFINQVGVIVSSIVFLNFLWGMIKNAFNYKVHTINVKFPSLPSAFNGFKIVQISDLHLGSFISTAPLEKAITIINELKPDIIFFTGDLVNDKASEAELFIPILKKLTAPLGVISILGNHDYGDYARWTTPEEKEKNLQLMFEIHREMGFKLLKNENVILSKNNEQLAIIGVENYGARGAFTKYGDLEKSLKGVENIEAKILLSHDPSHWDTQVIEKFKNIQLTLSGHTHGMQFGVEIPGFKWSPSQYFYPHWAGLYNINGQQLYVNRGLGFIGYAGRVGIMPEITLIELNSNS